MREGPPDGNRSLWLSCLLPAGRRGAPLGSFRSVDFFGHGGPGALLFSEGASRAGMLQFLTPGRCRGASWGRFRLGEWLRVRTPGQPRLRVGRCRAFRTVCLFGHGVLRRLPAFRLGRGLRFLTQGCWGWRVSGIAPWRSGFGRFRHPPGHPLRSGLPFLDRDFVFRRRRTESTVPRGHAAHRFFHGGLGPAGAENRLECPPARRIHLRRVAREFQRSVFETLRGGNVDGRDVATVPSAVDLPAAGVVLFFFLR